MSDTKFYLECKEEMVLNSDKFHKDKSHQKGFTYFCKICNNLRRKTNSENKNNKNKNQIHKIYHTFYLN